MTLNLPIDLANQIIGYLGTRPYQEVYQLIDGMQEAAKSTPLQEVSQDRAKEAA
jgi:hypothetical protein